MLWYPKPADSWTDGVAIGNGCLGAMVFSQPEKDRLQLNDITVWSGGPALDADRPEGYKALPEIRRLLRAEKFPEAERLVQQNMLQQGDYFPSYQTLGDLNLNFTLPEGSITDYQRWLDVSRALAGVAFKLNGDIYTREVFSSAPAGVIVMKLTTSRKGGLTFDVGLSRQVSATTSVFGSDTLLMKGNTDYAPPPRQGRRGAGANIPEAAPPVAPPVRPGAVGYEIQAKVIAKGGSIGTEGNLLKVTGADEATIVLAAGTTYVLDWSKGYKGSDPHGQVTRTLAAASAQPYDTLKRVHIEDFQRFFNRVDLQIGQTQAITRPTDQRIRDYKDGKEDPALAMLYYQFGRYLMISSSRPNNPLPSNSQGIWGDGLDLPWKCDYKSNINFQMNYWPAESGNLGEFHLPMIRLIQGLVEPGRKTAKAYFNAPGWVCAYTTNAFGWTSPGYGLPFGPFFGGSAWDCQHLWEHYAFSRDREYLKGVYPTMKEACEFCLATLVPDEKGLLVTSPSVSPENSFRTDEGVRGSVCEGAAAERQVIWDLFTNTIQAAKVLKLDEAFRRQLEETRARIRPPEIGKAGQLLEWGKDWDLNAPEPTHRHVSHLFALFPGRQITVEETPELAAAVKKSLELRGDGGTGWAKAWKINLWARLHDGDHAYKLLCDQLQLATGSGTNYGAGAGGTYANMFDAHPPFQIDGNFGGVSGVNEMLLQSHLTYVDAVSPDEDRYIIELLPALPSAWPSGHIKGLRARGGLEIDQVWSAGKLTAVTIRSTKGARCKVRYGNTTIDLILKTGQTVRLDAALTNERQKQ
jgi:alpha-L-fucosidase 2